MAKYAKRDEYRVGIYYLGQRGGSPAWYRCWTECTTPKRVSLNTTDFEEAKRLLNEWFVLNVRPENAPLGDVKLSDVLLTYYDAHASKLPSKGSQKTYYNVWRAFFGEDTVAQATKPQRQAAFRASLLARMKPSSAGRVVTFGKAALNRSYKLGELAALPYVQGIADGPGQPKKGRRLTLPEMKALFEAARGMEPHITRYLCLLLGTSARSGALFDLRWSQVELTTGIIDMNPPGRVPTKKRRAVIRACPYLLERLRAWHRQDGGEGFLIRYHGKPVASMKTAWHRLRDSAGLRNDELGDVTAYSFRHTTAWWCRSQGVSKWEVDALLAHSKGTTDIYADADPTYMQASRRAVEKLFQQVVKLPMAERRTTPTCQKLASGRGGRDRDRTCDPSRVKRMLSR